MSPNLNELSSFVKKGDLVEGDVIEFVNEGEIKEVDFKKGKGVEKVFQVKIKINDKGDIIVIEKGDR